MPHIPQCDVFISWTGKDRELKDRIASYLRDNKIEVLESDHACAGDFREWSREAVGKCTVFLCLYTEHTVDSEWVPVEIEELQKLDDWCNRCVPVVSDYKVYAANCPTLAEAVSAVLLGGRELTDEHLEKILFNVRNLINNRLFKVYREATKPSYLKLKSFLRLAHVQDREFDYETLYIPRAVTDADGNVIDNADAFTNADDILFLQGPAGSGKSCYIDQLRGAADENTLVMALACRKLTGVTDLKAAMFEEFRRHCGNRHFYTIEDFESLLAGRHLLLVLDGMDEIATKHGTRQFLDAVKAYYNANAASTTLFFTSRNEADAYLIAMNGQAPKRLTLRALEEEQIKAFGDTLFLLLDKPDKGEAFYVSVKALADEIRTNPLLLSQLAIVYANTDRIPQTTVGIYDAVCEITLKHEDDIADIPESYRETVTMKLPTILKKFSSERYRLARHGDYTTEEVLSTVLEEMAYPDPDERTAFLLDYLNNRAILIEDEFYHKMLLEYFTAVDYYEAIFDRRKAVKDIAALRGLFINYTDPYWSAVLQLFLIKADSTISGETTTALYTEITACGITEYTLLFDTCRDLLCHKQEAQCALLRDILKKSADGTYPPYGPLCWYVPEYALYEPLLLTLESMTDESCFTKALALTRDVCWIFGRFNTATDITDRVNGEALFEAADNSRKKCRLFKKKELIGVRRGLCELFFTGETNETGYTKICPRCFNLAEAKSRKDCGQGVFGRMSIAFEDKLGLYSHEMFSELGGEYIGVVVAPYDRDYLEEVLPQKSCKKLCGLFFSPTEDTYIQPLAINDRHVKRVYIPENAKTVASRWKRENGVFVTERAFLYFHSTVCLPEGVTEIGEYAFGGCTSLTSVTIPDSVTEIEEDAFWGCTSLASVTIPDSVTAIGGGAFEGCTSLTSVTIPKCVTIIEEDTFKGCRSLTSVTIPDSVTEIGKYAFAGCASLTSVTISGSVTKIGWSAFEGCTSLTSVTIPDSVTIIKERAFARCASLTSVTIPDSVTEIGWDAFANCTSLTSVTIPDSVTIIERGAFEGCTSLTSVTIPEGVTKIGRRAFEGCTSLASVTIPDSVTAIGERAFSGCRSLTAVTIPDGVIEIGRGAFSGCQSLTAVTIPDSVTTIGEGAFADCDSLSSVINCPPGYPASYLGVPEGIVQYADAKEEDKVFVVPPGTRTVTRTMLPVNKRKFVEQIVFSDGVKGIGKQAFKGCTSLTSVTIPDSVTEIGGSAFEGCTSLGSVTIPEGVTKIGWSAFEGCTSLGSVTIPEGVTKIGGHAFEGCTSLASVTIPDSVTKIEAWAFARCTSLTSVTIPEGVTEIETRAFSECTSLTAVTILEGVTRIGWSAFEGCTSLTAVTIPNGVTEIGWSVFEGCASLTSVTIPDSVTKIEVYTFKGCTSLTAVTIPNGVTTIGWRAFEGCTSLTSVTIPDSVTEIGGDAFWRCTSLASVTIPERVTKIEWGAFKGCASLTSVTVPASAKTVGDDAFAGCTGLKEITISRRFEDELDCIFSGVDLSQVTIHWL